MPNVCFYLKKAEKSTKKCLIYLRFKYQGRKVEYSFGQSISKKNWNPGKQRVKDNQHTTADGEHSLNDLLNNLESVLVSAYRNEIKNGVPEPDVLKRYLIRFYNPEADDKTEFFGLLDRFISGEIKREDMQEKSKGTTKVYGSIRKHLRDFETAKRYPISYDTINREFYLKYVAYLSTLDLSPNYKAKHIQVIKTVMNEAVRSGYTQNLQHKLFKVKWVETEAVYLTDKEIQKLFNYDFSNDKKLESVRDLFVFGCSVGLRFSDYSTINPENIIDLEGEKYIKVRTKKTGELVVIPCYPVVLKIFGKYSDSPNRLPKTISNQKFNDYIKDACKAAGLTEKGRLLSEPEKELWECVSSHTCRRSFATNLYLENYPPMEIMKITGHRTEKQFLKYIKVSRLDAAKRLSRHIQMKNAEKIMKAV